MSMYRSSENQREVPAEARIWQAVILQAVEEWRSGPLRVKRKAEDYLFNDNIDFPEVCRRAGMDPARLREQMTKLRGTPDQIARPLAA